MSMLENKTALITGGSRGIGRAIAIRFAQEGCAVAFTYRANEAEAEETLRQLRAFGIEAMGYKVDAADFDAAHELVKQVAETFGRIDILVNNAGITRDTLMLRMTEQQWDEVIDTNLKSAFNYIHAVTPLMARQRGGSIINMSSVVGLTGNAGQTNYSASKAALVALSKSVAKELGARGIRANCIAPGFIQTDMTGALTDEQQQQIIQQIPMKRAGQAEDVANTALFLASDMSNYVSGQVIGVNGAMV